VKFEGLQAQFDGAQSRYEASAANCQQKLGRAQVMIDSCARRCLALLIGVAAFRIADPASESPGIITHSTGLDSLCR